MTEVEVNIAREAILNSIRAHLSASAPHDVVHAESRQESPELLEAAPPNGYRQSAPLSEGDAAMSLIETFRTNLEAVGGHCIIVRGETELVGALNKILSTLQNSQSVGRRVALSDAPCLERLVDQMTVPVDRIAIRPRATELFDSAIGISTAQAAIAETGTLMLDSEAERHRLVSLVPPVHIAVVDAANIYLTLGEALAVLEQGPCVSPAITFITGPSRTADIELTLAIGVHGPQELYVIVNEGPALTSSKTGSVLTGKGTTT